MVLVVLTLVWGVNWPIMKVGIADYPPLSFRTMSIWIGVPVMGLALWATRAPLRIAREHWPALLMLTLTNMLVWQSFAMLALKSLSSGRAAILAYTMPIFAAIFGGLFWGQRLSTRAVFGIAAAGVGVLLLLWHELTHLSGRPLGVLMMLVAASTWAVGTHQMRRTAIPASTLAMTFWMTLCTAVAMSLLSFLFERDQWYLPSAVSWASIVYNGVMIFGFAQAAWLFLARGLPPVASSLSVMFIPVLGVFSGALTLGEVLHWQDWTAVVLMMVAIASVLLPARPAPVTT